MQIHQLKVTNYRSHVNLQVEFTPGFNVIVGLNGSGKTSLLKAICDGLTGFTDYVSLKRTHYAAFSDPTVARQSVEKIEGRFRFTDNYPVKVAISATIFGTSFDWEIKKTDQAARPQSSGILPGLVWSNRGQALPFLGNPSSNVDSLPVLAFYKANRQWNTAQTNELQAATSKNSRTDGYETWADAALDSNALQTWVVAKSLERFQTTSESGRLFDDIKDDELALVNNALAKAVDGLKGIKYDVRQKSLLLEWENIGEAIRLPTLYDNLSDGQRTIVGLVADISRRMCLLNPHLGVDVNSATSGVVLIDELDMHLHPKWQRQLTKGLKTAFPNVQFIVASHSPQVLGELRPDEIILLSEGTTSHPSISYGLTSSEILEILMDAEARAPEVELTIAQLFENIERDNSQAAASDLVILESQAPGIPEISAARALIKRKEVMRR